MSTASSATIARSTCFHHPQREAAARCVGCGRPFCRECITPVDRRMYCFSCFKEQTGVKERKARDWFVLSISFQGVLGLAGLWVTAYFLGRLLLELPSNFHEGTVWSKLLP